MIKFCVEIEITGETEEAYRRWFDSEGLKQSVSQGLDQAPLSSCPGEDMALGIKADLQQFFTNILSVDQIQSGQDIKVDCVDYDYDI